MKKQKVKKKIYRSHTIRWQENYPEDTYKKFLFPARGCSFSYRKRNWHAYLSSISDSMNRQIDNSYLFFETEPDNDYDPNAIKINVGGEMYGTCGYVGKEFVEPVKAILDSCSQYRLEMLDESQAGKGTIDLVLIYQ